MGRQSDPEEDEAPRRRAAGRPREFDPIPVIASAQELLTTGGLPALTIRALSKKSGVTVTSIYRNLGDRDAVLGAVLDAAALEVTPPVLPRDPAAQIETIFRSMYDFLTDQRWALEIMTRTHQFGASAMWYVEQFFIAADALGIDEDRGVIAYRQLWAYTAGALFTAAHGDSPEHRARPEREKLARIADTEGFPRLRRFLTHADGLTRDGFLEGLRRQISLLTR